MTWTWLQSASHEGVSSGGSIAATYAGNLSSGSKLIVLVASDAAVTPSVSDGTNTFTQAVLVSGSTGGAVIFGLYFLDTPAGDVGTKPTITASGLTGTTDSAILIAEVSGLVTGNTNALALDGSPATSQVTSAATVNQPAYTSHASGYFLITCNGDNGGPQTWTDPAGYQGATAGPGSSGAAEGINFNSGANVELAYKNSTNGAESGTWSFSATGGAFTGTGFIVVAFKVIPAAGIGYQSRQRPKVYRYRYTPRPATFSQPSAAAAPAATFYPQGLIAVRSRGLPPRGQVRSNAGVYNQAGPPVYPLHSAVAQGGTSAAVSRNGAALPARGRTQSRPGTPEGTGAAFYPFRHPLTAVVRPLPLRGRTESRQGTFQGTGAPLTQLRRPVQARQPLAPHGRTQGRAGIFTATAVQAAFYPLNQPARARIPAPSWRGTCRSMAVLTTTVAAAAVAPFYPQGLIAPKGRGFPPRGRTAGRTGTFTPVVIAITPPALGQPSGVRVIYQRTGLSLSQPGTVQPAGPAVYPLQRPVAAVVRPLPGRGRTQGRSGTFTAVVPHTAVAYPLSQPARARLAPPSWRGTCRSMAVLTTTVVPAVTAQFYPLNRPVAAIVRPQPARGRTSGRSGIFAQAGPAARPLQRPVQARRPLPPRGTAQWRYGTFTPVTPVQSAFYPLNRPAAAVVRPQPPRGQVRGNAGARGQAGPPLVPQQRALRARLPQQPFLKGRTSGNPGVYEQAGPKVTPLRGPVSAVSRGFPPRGRAAGRAGIFTAVTQPGPPVYPLHAPVAAVIRPLPPRGRAQGHAGVFRGSGPAVKPLQHPVYAWRPGPRRGVCLTSIRPAPPSGTGSAFYPFRKALRAWVPPPRRGRSLSLAGTFTFIGSGQDVTWRTWAPRSGWDTGEPHGRWSDGAPGSGWAAGDPFTRTFTGPPLPGWTESGADLQ